MALAGGWRRHVIGVVMGVVLASSSAWAQQTAGITGVVQDESGSVLPGVTVDVTSPALITGRTVVTDGEGRYSVTALVTGTYTVTFTLPGFSTVRREGIGLTSGFVATVNAELTVGGVEETITVTGASPVVDTTSVKAQTLMSQELVAALPTSNLSLSAIQDIVPGVVKSSAGIGSQAVGGSKGTFWGNSMGVTYHGKRNGRILYDGMPVNDFVNSMIQSGNVTRSDRLEASGLFLNMATLSETAFETSAAGADSLSSGLSFNGIPQTGSNRFSARGHFVFGKDALIADNTEGTSLSAAGKPTTLLTGYASVGGPIKQDRLWFFTAPKVDYMFVEQQDPWNYNLMHGTPFYVPDPDRPSDLTDRVQSYPVRLTWRASDKDTVNGFFDTQPYCGCPQFAPPLPWAAEAQYFRLSRGTLTQATWVRPQTNRVLLEAGFSYFRFRVDVPYEPRTSADVIAVRDTTRNLQYNARLPVGVIHYGDKETDRYASRASLSYVTGSHNLKVGYVMDSGRRLFESKLPSDRSYVFRGSNPNIETVTPLSVIIYATPYTLEGNQNADLIAYVQDRWTINRLTVNAGLQFQYTNAEVPAQNLPATQFVPVARSFDKLPNSPNYKDFNPRLGVAYDLFGNGRTAIKASVSRYTLQVGTGLAQDRNPVESSFSSVTRDWSDSTFGPGDPRTGNYVPDCDLLNSAINGECGAWQTPFATTRAGTVWDPRTTEGWHNRDGYWEVTAEVQQQLAERLSMTVGYYRNWMFNLRTVRNTLVNPDTDYSPFSVVAPVDSRLPGGGGYTITNLYDLNPDKLGQVSNVIVPASDYGDHVEQNDFVAVTLQGRLGWAQLGGGIDAGRSVKDTCFVVNSPQEAFYRSAFPVSTQMVPCRQVAGFADQTQVRFFAALDLPGGMALSAIYSNSPGIEQYASRTFTRAQIVGLGRQLSTASVAVPLFVDDGVHYDDRKQLVDLQLSKAFHLGNGWRVRPQLGVYNLFNSAATATVGSVFGPAWGPLTAIAGRTFQFAAEVTF